MWTCRKCGSRWNGNKLRCGCGRARPKRKPSHKDVLADMPYEDWVRRFGETCGICGASPTGNRRLDRDHDHSRLDAPRGLLCHRCNRALPNWVTAGWLIAAAHYLERAALDAERD